jgi:tetratricopeptide (TPR) repeat protein
MRLRFIIWTTLILFWAAAGQQVWAAASKGDALLQEARQLYATSKDAQALQKYQEVLEIEPNCYEALCNSSLLYSRIGTRFPDIISKLNYFESAWNFADKALCVNNDGADGNYAMALSVYNKALASGLKERMRVTKVIKFYLDKALCEDSKHADSWQLLGRWYFKNANLTAAETAALNMFFDGAPLEVSNEKAVEALQKAIKFNPENISYYYDLALVYWELQKPDLCELTLEEAGDLKLVTTEELEISRRCKALLSKIDKS